MKLQRRLPRKRNRDNFILIPLLTAFSQGAIVLVVPDRNGRYMRYNVISSLNDHVETNRGKTGKKKGGVARRGKDWREDREGMRVLQEERGGGGQDRIAKLEMARLRDEDKEVGSSGFIRVKIISLSGSLNKYRGKLNAVSGSRGE